jgi:hypothetical protein
MERVETATKAIVTPRRHSWEKNMTVIVARVRVELLEGLNWGDDWEGVATLGSGGSHQSSSSSGLSLPLRGQRSS